MEMQRAENFIKEAEPTNTEEDTWRLVRWGWHSERLGWVAIVQE